MKKNLLLPLGMIAAIFLSCSNNSTTAGKVQNNNYLVSMEGIDSIKLEMTKAELEKLLDTTIQLPNLAGGGAPDTIITKYRGMDITLYFDGGNDSTATLRGIQTSNSSCKTATGIGVGSEKINVINAYEDHTKYVAPEYEVYPVRSATKSAVAVMDTVRSNAIIFHILDKKVASVEVQSYYEFY